MCQKLYVGDIVELNTNIPAGWREFHRGRQKFEVIGAGRSRVFPYQLINLITEGEEEPHKDVYEESKGFRFISSTSLEND